MAENQGFGSFRHLAVRFFGALDPRGPAPDSEIWALGWLVPGERDLWRRMSGPDRRHAAGVAREVAGLLGWTVDSASGAGAGAFGAGASGAGAATPGAGAATPGAGAGASGASGAGASGASGASGVGEPAREVMASALLHDVGKVESGLGTFARVAVTLAAIGLGRDRLVAASTSTGLRRRVSDYLTHDQIGAELLRQAGSHPDTVAWAGEHHLPPERWTLDRRVADALKAADGD